jgi:hypothetical protein
MISSYFDVSNLFLGSSINIQQLNVDLLNIDGIDQIYTRNKVTGNYVRGLRFIYWNPVYFSQTVAQASSIIPIKDFQFPFLNNKAFVERIVVV